MLLKFTLAHYIMDSRHHSQNQNQNQDQNQNHNLNHNHSHNPHNHANYAFNSTQNDTFNSFLQNDTDSAFTNPWDPDAFADPQESIAGYNSGSQAWNPNAMQPSNLLSVSNYGAQPRNLDQTFSGNPSFSNYSGFDSRSNLSMATSSFDPNLAYGHVPLNDDGNFDFTRTQGFHRTAKPSETISPQALQNYPTSFNHVQIPDARPVCLNIKAYL